MLVVTFSVGIVVGRAFSPCNSPLAETLPLVIPVRTPNSAPRSTDSIAPADVETLFKPFWQTWEIVHDQYVDQPVDDEAMMRGAIQGMLDSLGDQHTSYMDPDQFSQANIPLEGEYEGIGAWVDPTGKYLTIVSPMPDSPAENAGLKPGDQIVAINGEDMTGIDGNLVIRRVLGPAGTSVSLPILREGEAEPFDVTLERAHIVVPSVETKMLDGDIAYVQLFTFGENSNEELRRTLKEILAEKPVGLILDLRNNPGGALKTAIEVASEFVGNGVIMYEEYGDGRRGPYEALQGGLGVGTPAAPRSTRASWNLT